LSKFAERDLGLGESRAIQKLPGGLTKDIEKTHENLRNLDDEKSKAETDEKKNKIQQSINDRAGALAVLKKKGSDEKCGRRERI
jgi:hypothetical protein